MFSQRSNITLEEVHLYCTESPSVSWMMYNALYNHVLQLILSRKVTISFLHKKISPCKHELSSHLAAAAAELKTQKQPVTVQYSTVQPGAQ